ncbi:arsenic resistance protein [Saccharothrix deserti]|uniref:arsenic resistance protein n=1 Tax=Saccharothrix deserti TaxID=2593674 RepID=UPI00131A695C|nr:bile acid:sodium symporter [Saccharothrix deserti]
MTTVSTGSGTGLERYQVPVFVGALAAGLLVGWAVPGATPVLEHAINPVLGALLYVTFLQVPVIGLAHSLRTGRFLAATLVVNFVVVPLVVAAMFGLLPADQAVRLGVLLVLLTPCIDYVIVFSNLGGGSGQRLLATTPLLLITQLLLLPLYLMIFMGAPAADLIQTGPFIEAFLVLIVIPLALAWLTQAWAARRPAGRKFTDRATKTTAPLMAATLLTVVASQVPKLGDSTSEVAAVIPFYVAFLLFMAFAGMGVSRLFRLDTPDSRAVVFTGAARNSLVVLPLALALPEASAVAVAVIVTQTLVEVVGMILYIRTVPKLLPPRTASRSAPWSQE